MRTARVHWARIGPLGRHAAPVRLCLSAAVAVIAALALCTVQASPAAAAPTGAAKSATKRALLERGLEPIKVGCRAVGQRRAKAARCRWSAAQRRARGTFTCKGTGELAAKGAALRFRQGSCRFDRGGSRLTASAPKRFAKQGFEATDGFCWGLLGRGFKCRFEAIRFADRTYACQLVATQRKRSFRIQGRRCAVDPAATAAQQGVAAALAAEGLNATSVRCRQSDSGWRCEWRASRGYAGWTYSCSGEAHAAAPGGPFELGPCRLRAPRLAPLRAPNPKLHFGVNEVWRLLAGEIHRAARLGSDTLRTTLNWSAVERSPGSYTFEPFDHLYGRMLAAGVRPLIVVIDAPCWAAASGARCNGPVPVPPSPAHDAAWRDFIATVAQRYPEAQAIEVWNEPNFDLFLAGAPDPSRYARLLNLAVDGAAGRLPVISGGLAAFTKNRPGKMRYDVYLRRVLAAGGRADAIGHHAYSGRRLRQQRTAGLREQVADLKDVMVDFGLQELPVWITETGISTAQRSVSEREQARTIASDYQKLRRIPGIDALIFHRWRDQTGRGPESGFGLTTRKGKSKKALCKLAAARGRSCPR